MDIQQIIKERYKVLPTNIQQAITATDLAPKFQKIADKHGLRIDQNGNLQTETILVMLGLETVDDYIDNVKKGLEISREEAVSIAKDVNTEILDAIRDSLKEIQRQTEENDLKENISEKETRVATANGIIDQEKTISSIEKAGDFIIEQNPPSSSPQYKEQNINKENILKGIEDDHIPMVDHLLTTSVNNQSETETKAVPEIKRVEEKKAYTVDPYREQT